ncbi:MAG TPA: hypothetical protein VNV82_19425, partial [Bryobacteraceae bacterium]|nr:hypothetical protein [Bryobacteraceae bacterium]
RDAVGNAGRNLAEVKHDDSESAGVKQIVSGFECVPGIMTAADPDQLGKCDSGCGGGCWIE